MQRTIFLLKQSIEAEGHSCFLAREAQSRLKGNLRRTIRLVESTAADAWIVLSGSGELLEWFSRQSFPTMALGGRTGHLPIAAAGTDLAPAMTAAVRHLCELGHRRIVMICPRAWRKPAPARLADRFSAALAEYEAVSSDYHLPEWDETPEGLIALLHTLFQITPPTALILVEPSHAVATLCFLSQQGLQIGNDVSLVCLTDDPAFAWSRSSLACAHSKDETHVRRIVRWVRSVASGNPEKTKKFTSAVFEPIG